jgi:hypothetical protein
VGGNEVGGDKVGGDEVGVPQKIYRKRKKSKRSSIEILFIFPIFNFYSQIKLN